MLKLCMQKLKSRIAAVHHIMNQLYPRIPLVRPKSQPPPNCSPDSTNQLCYGRKPCSSSPWISSVVLRTPPEASASMDSLVLVIWKSVLVSIESSLHILEYPKPNSNSRWRSSISNISMLRLKQVDNTLDGDKNLMKIWLLRFKSLGTWIESGSTQAKSDSLSA